MTITEKRDHLKEIISNHAPLLIAYSGGVDSTLLAVIAKETLGTEHMVCILVDGPEVPRKSLEQARLSASHYGLPLRVIPGNSLSADLKKTNPPDRCRYCKLETFQTLSKAAGEYSCRHIADGANTSDLGEHRPGIEAFSSCGVIHPFIMAGITKQEIREIAKGMGLSFWNTPSSACLYSRIPYGEEISDEKLAMIEKGEEVLKDLGYEQVRVRHHGTVARIEVSPESFADIIRQRITIEKRLSEIGFRYITLDLKGYRSGSMDEVLSVD